MGYCKSILLLFIFNFSILSSAEFTISSYNCGGLSEHYDYLRAASMQKLMQERYVAESENMELNEKIQKLAIKILFSQSSEEKIEAQQEWDQKGYESIFKNLTQAPTEFGSPNTVWNQKANKIISSYQVRPVVIFDNEVNQMIKDHVKDLTNHKEGEFIDLLEEARGIMFKRIIQHHLKHDIICIQEGDYLDISMFPDQYEVLFADTTHSKNGIAWNKERFELIEIIGNILGKAFAVQLRDKESDKIVLVASGHISGCNPYCIQKHQLTGKLDSSKGDSEIRAIIKLLNSYEADLMLIGMDSNVTSLHPRLRILKNAGYQIDYRNHLEPTCTNPYQVLNTRIDWIAVKNCNKNLVSITNIPILSVGLNSIITNISDHKPIAAKIKY